MFIWYSEFINKRNFFMSIGLESLDQVLFLMLIMDSLIHSQVKKRRGELISMLRILRVRVRKHRVLRINHWKEMKRIKIVGMKVRGKMMIVRVKLFRV